MRSGVTAKSSDLSTGMKCSERIANDEALVPGAGCIRNSAKRYGLTEGPAS